MSEFSLYGYSPYWAMGADSPTWASLLSQASSPSESETPAAVLVDGVAIAPEKAAADTRTPEQRLEDAAALTKEEASRSWLAKGLTRGGDFAGSLADWAEKERAREDAQNVNAFNMASSMSAAVPSMWNMADTMRMRTGGLGAMAGGR